MEPPPPDSCAAFTSRGNGERECWHSDGCPYSAAFDPAEAEHSIYDLERLYAFVAFSVESNDIPIEGAKAPPNGKAPTERVYSLSLERFRLALEVWQVPPEGRQQALTWAAEYASACNRAKDVARERQRDAQRKRLEGMRKKSNPSP